MLHIWTQDLRAHLHVHALSRVFRGKFLSASQNASDADRLPRDPQATAAQRIARLQALRRCDWVVYARTRLAGPAAVPGYLARYTHRTAIGNERLQAIQGDQVRLRVRTSAASGQPAGKRSIVIDGVQFVARLLQQVLLPGFKCIRHYGPLAAAPQIERCAHCA